MLPANDVFFTYEWIFGPTYKLNLRAYNFNGSGVDEIMLKQIDFTQFNFADMSSYHGFGNGPIGFTLSDLKFLEGDFNGDGISEFIVSLLKEGYEEIWGYDWNGYPELQGTANIGSEVFEFYIDPSEGIVKKRNEPLSDYTALFGPYIAPFYYKPIPIGDFNGDGKADLFGLKNGTKIYS